jgi:hypothetical protein
MVGSPIGAPPRRGDVDVHAKLDQASCQRERSTIFSGEVNEAIEIDSALRISIAVCW